MAQTPCIRRQTEGDSIDYTPVGAVTNGDVILLSTALVGIASRAIAAGELGAVDLEGVFTVPKDSSSVVIGTPLYWNATGNPVGGTASSGAFTSNSALGIFGGWALATAGGSAGTVDMLLRSADDGATPQSFSAMQAAAVTVGGTAIGNANAVSYGFTRVTGANNTAAVKLPAATAGAVCVLKSLTSGSTLQVFPTVGDKINGAAANAVYNMANLSFRVFVAYDSTDWYTDPETPT